MKMAQIILQIQKVNISNMLDEKKFNLFNSNINPNSNSIDIGNKNLENFSSSEKTGLINNFNKMLR